MLGELDDRLYLNLHLPVIFLPNFSRDPTNCFWVSLLNLKPKHSKCCSMKYNCICIHCIIITKIIEIGEKNNNNKNKHYKEICNCLPKRV